ncbi:sulfurtransferase complex subunit TusD [Dongshaea marina]|uniref:sulfurtransferase complex subunit TusD n=1 Tax=Dongshaea marina TaxID=2047966 RepID=UPI000D3E0DC9|nr:sulfurtransferase complex subunit TusD [Dongshaea marina]
MSAPLTFALLISGPPYGNSRASRALQLARAILNAGHKLPRIFFYQDGVLNANSLLAPASDEFDLHQGWCELAQQQGVQLEICVAAAQRRGVLDQNEARLARKPGSNTAVPFEMTGLLQLSEITEQCDRLIQL